MAAQRCHFIMTMWKWWWRCSSEICIVSGVILWSNCEKCKFKWKGRWVEGECRYFGVEIGKIRVLNY
jgi:hypothetical protein